MNNHKLVFDSRSESDFYAQCLQRYLFERRDVPSVIAECGSGDGLPVIKAIKSSDYKGKVLSCEINQTAHKIATKNIVDFGMTESYQVYNASFFENEYSQQKDFLISDPPFLPALSGKIIDPYLRGGDNGNEFTMNLMGLGYKEMVLMIPSYTDPVATLEFALENNYEVIDFLISPMELTFYSRDPEVYSQLLTLKKEGRAFFVEDYFLLAGVHFRKSTNARNEKHEGLIKIMSTIQ